MPNRVKFLVLAAIGLMVVLVGGLGAVYFTMRPVPKSGADNVTVEVSDTTCTPGNISVAAGAPRFSIKNTSSSAIEWEILDGVMVLAERENIAPGFTVELAPRLEPGTYQITCGKLSNPRGALTVTAADGSTTALPAPPKLADLVAPTAEYRVYAISSANDLTAAMGALQAAVKSGDLGTARLRSTDAETALSHIAPILHLFDRDASPLTTGPTALPALRTSLAASPTPGNLAGLADDVARTAVNLGGTVRATTAAPHEIVAGAGNVVADLAKGFDDPALVGARIAGVRKVVELFQPLTQRADKLLAGKLDSDLTAIEGALGKSPAPDHAVLQPQLADLSADMTALLSALGLNAS